MIERREVKEGGRAQVGYRPADTPMVGWGKQGWENGVGTARTYGRRRSKPW
jgi:hypothetical protein